MLVDASDGGASHLPSSWPRPYTKGREELSARPFCLAGVCLIVVGVDEAPEVPSDRRGRGQTFSYVLKHGAV